MTRTGDPIPRRPPCLTDLHDRVLNGDQLALEAIAQYSTQALHRQLRRAFRHVDADVLQDAAVDAFMDYARCPRRFHSSRFKSLDRFLYTSAWRNVADSLTADARRRRREARFVRETAFHDGSPKFTDQSVGIGSNTTPWLLDVATDDSERQALKRWLLGERRTGPLAQSLCFDGLPVPAQRREVKKFKDRIRKRLARLARVQEPQVRVRR